MTNPQTLGMRRILKSGKLHRDLGRLIVSQARELEQLREDNRQLRCAIALYREALERSTIHQSN